MGVRGQSPPQREAACLKATESRHVEGLSGEVSCLGHHRLDKEGKLRGW